MNTRVIIIEDDAVMRDHLAGVIGDLPSYRVVRTAATYAQGERAIKQAEYDLALIDLALPDGNGIGLIRQVSALPGRKSMVISVFGDRRSVLDATAAGVDGYLLKDGNLEQISRAVQQVVAGHTPISPAVATHLIRQLRSRPNNDAEADALTAREHEVLSHLARGYTYKEIAAQCDISTNTVSFHTKQIYDKLCVNSRSEAIYKALNAGILDIATVD
ncbi:MAG: response regulator transcription factor [Pseudomonadota bacterium]